MLAPLFVMINVAVPSLDVHAPVTVRAGAAGGCTQVDISAAVVSALSFGLDNVYEVDEPFTVMVVLAPAANWKVEVWTMFPFASLTL